MIELIWKAKCTKCDNTYGSLMHVSEDSINTDDRCESVFDSIKYQMTISPPFKDHVCNKLGYDPEKLNESRL